MASLSSQISSAVTVALSPSPAIPQADRHAAHLFLSQVKDAKSETWTACWELFLEHKDGIGGVGGRWSSESRMFGIQVVGESIPTLSPEALAFLQSSLLDYFSREYVSGPSENGVAFLKNASLHLTTLVFLHLYPTSTPSILSTFLSLLRQYPSTVPSTTLLNPSTTDILLRLLHEISQEIGDAQLRLNKSPTRLAKDAELRDAVRIHDAVAIAATLYEIIGECLEGLGKPEGKVGLTGKAARELGEMAIRVVGDYVSWIDINLMITPTSIPLLLAALHLPSTADIGMRTATAEALTETVTKGMPAVDKLALLNVLDIGTVLGRLVDYGREGGKEKKDEKVEAFRTKLGGLLNGVGSELCRIADDTANDATTKAAAMATATTLFPILLRFLGDSNEETSLSVVPFINHILLSYKKDKKRSATDPSAALGETSKTFLSELLRVALGKMEYGAEVEWSMDEEGEEDEEALQFAERRKSLRVVVDAIAALDLELYSGLVRSLVMATIDAYEAGGPTATGLTWQRLELALYLLYGFGQAAGAIGPAAFVQVPPTEIQRSKRETDYRIDFTQFPLSTLGEMMHRTCRSKVVAYPHAAVNLQFFEISVRYHEFFKLCPEFILEILPSYLDEHGLHQPEEPVQARVFYLFSRFLYQAKSIVQAQLSGDVISNILGRMQDLLVIDAELLSSEPATKESLVKAVASNTAFESRLYVFETVGTLISILNQVPTQQVALLRAVLTPLLTSLQSSVRTTATTHADFSNVLKAHQYINAIGNVAKGFPDLSSRASVATGDWVEVFREATETVLIAAKSMSDYVVIRDAARAAFNKIVATTGEAVLPLIPALIDCLIGEITFPELGDLLGFLGLLVAKYKAAFGDILDVLLMPVFERVFHFLKLPITGTDDTILHSVLRRAYFAFLLSICSVGMEPVFYSPKNKPHLHDILQSVTHYIANDSLAPDQRLGFIALTKFASLWVTQAPGTTPVAGTTAVTTSPVDGFEKFLYANAVGLCFQVPLMASFDYSDAGSYQVIAEICNLLKTLLQKRGPEFLEFMNSTLLPSIQCPPTAGSAFMAALQASPDGKSFKKFASEWLKSSRGTP